MTRHLSDFGGLADRVQQPSAAAAAERGAGSVQRRDAQPVRLSDGTAGLLIAWLHRPGEAWWGQVVTIRNALTESPSVSWTWYPQDQISPLPSA